MKPGNYRLNSTWEGLKADSDHLLATPHPASFTEGEVVGMSESFYPIELGLPSARWTYENQLFTAAAWEQLRSYVDASGQGLVYIQTRTNKITDGSFTYSRFRGRMRRPEGTPVPPWRMRDVEVEFFALEQWSDEKEAEL